VCFLKVVERVSVVVDDVNVDIHPYTFKAIKTNHTIQIENENIFDLSLSSV